MAAEPLSLRALNRALLARQHLLERTRDGIPQVLDHLVGLQAQEPLDPYVALSSRIEGFDPAALGGLLEEGDAVRLTLFRGTIHLVNTDDAYAVRPLVQPAVDRIAANFRKGYAVADAKELEAQARKILAKGPLTYAELGKRLAARWPDGHAESLARRVQALVPLAQVPPRGVWGKSGPSRHLPLDAWAPRRRARALTLDALVLRYLAAFGPASARDATAWSGITHLQEVFERLGKRLVRFQSPDGTPLYDLPKAPRPDEDVPAPARFLPVYDNLVLGFRDRARIVAVSKHVPLFRENELVRFVLIDGTLGAAWKIESAKAGAVLTVSPFAAVQNSVRREVAEEAERLLAMWEPDAKTHRVAWKPR